MYNVYMTYAGRPGSVGTLPNERAKIAAVKRQLWKVSRHIGIELELFQPTVIEILRHNQLYPSTRHRANACFRTIILNGFIL